jgi:hypothetical protein
MAFRVLRTQSMIGFNGNGDLLCAVIPLHHRNLQHQAIGSQCLQHPNVKCQSPHPAALAPAPFFFFSSITSILSSGISFKFSFIHSSISYATSPCTVISSPPPGIFVTPAPQANFFPKSLAIFFSSRSKFSNPWTHITYFLLLRSMRLIRTLEEARFSASRFSCAAAFEAFFCASFSARFCASTDKVERFWAMASSE